MRLLLACAALGSALAIAACSPRGASVDQQRIERADEEPGNWMSHGRTYGEERYSPLDFINDTNVGQLQLAWSAELDAPRAAEATPIVVDGVMYVTSAWSIVYALDAATGERKWKYDPAVPRSAGANACCDVGNRGVAVWRGKIYVGTIDGRLIAINARDGSKAWEQNTLTDPSRPYTITGAPRAAHGLIYIGNGGAEYGVRGYVSAYDAETGDLKWRFFTTPNPREPDRAASDSTRDRALATWNPNAGAWLESGGGGTAWDAIVFDPEEDTLWIGVGNGSPWNRDVRSPNIEGRNNDNLFLSSVVGVDPQTGEYKCHYQETPGETWDYTATQPIILTTLTINNEERKVLLHAPKNGFFYVIDRTDCSLISHGSIATQTWASGIDDNGRPIENPEARYASQTAIVLPSPFGAHNWHPMSMSRQTGLVYIPIQELAQDYTQDSAFVYRPGRWNTGTTHAALPDDRATRAAVRNSLKGYLLAWDPVNQRQAWRVELPGAWNGGTLATAGNLVFQGTVDGHFGAYNARTGERLWYVDNGAATLGGPVTYMAGEQQYVATLSGYGSVFFLAAGFAAPREGDNLNSRVNVYRIGGTATLPPRNLERLATPQPPAIRASAQVVSRGSAVYHQFCNVCHGPGAVGGGAIPDLRRSETLQSAQVWLQTVHGARAENGMPDFTQWVTAADVEAIRAYVARQAQALYQEEQARQP